MMTASVAGVSDLSPRPRSTGSANLVPFHSTTRLLMTFPPASLSSFTWRAKAPKASDGNPVAPTLAYQLLMVLMWGCPEIVRLRLDFSSWSWGTSPTSHTFFTIAVELGTVESTPSGKFPQCWILPKLGRPIVKGSYIKSGHTQLYQGLVWIA